MRYKYFLLLFYLCIVQQCIGSVGESIKKKSGEKEKENSEEDDDIVPRYNKIADHVIKIVEAPDLTKVDEEDRRKVDSDDETDADEAFKLFFQKQKKLLRRMMAQVEHYYRVQGRC